MASMISHGNARGMGKRDLMGGAEESEKSLILASDADALLATAVATALGRRWCTMRVGIRPCLLERMIDRETSALARASAHPLQQQQPGEQKYGKEGQPAQRCGRAAVLATVSCA
jgi:hypothetical protein